MTTDTLSPAARRPGFRLSRLSVWIAAACVLMGAAPSALAQSGAVSGGTVERNARFVTVTAQGTVSATPDLATITAGVVTEAETAQEAMRLNARRITRMVRALEELGIERRDRQTTAFNVTPQRDRRSKVRTSAGPQIIGYQVTNQLRVRVRKIQDVGAIVDELAANGSNSMGGVQFTFADPERLRETARRRAVANAIDQARTLANAAGARLGEVISIQEGGARPPRMATRMRSLSAESAATPILAGEQNVNVAVTATFALD